MSRVERQSAESLQQEFSDQVRRGFWQQGARLSTRDLGRRFGAHRATIQRALQRLEQEGLVECRSRSGWYVCAKVPGALRLTDRRTQLPLRRLSPTRTHLQVALSVGVDTPTDLFNDSTWSGTILNHLRQRLAERQVDLLLWNHDPKLDADPTDVTRRLDEARERILGIAALNPLELKPIESLLDERGVPWVTVNRQHPKIMHNFVATDQAWTGRVVGKLFARMGWQRVGIMVGAMDLFPSEREAFEGFCGGYASVHGGLPQRLDVIACNNSSQHAGHNAMTEHLRKCEPLQAVFCSGDSLALGGMRAAQDLGLRVPRDIGFIGNSGFELGQWAKPALTTVSQPLAQVGAAWADMLLHMHEHRLQRVPGRFFDGPLVFRQSLRVSESVQREIEAMQRPLIDSATASPARS